LFCGIPFSTLVVGILTSSSEENLSAQFSFQCWECPEITWRYVRAIWRMFSPVPPISVSVANAIAATWGQAFSWSQV